ncbi:MAG: transcriptional regulator [Acidobacteria bacterium]|nr:transcriptional regulator [Acidobacteriota bacterium]
MPLDPLVHAPIRLAVLSVLVVNEEAEFTFLRRLTGATDGNLATHLRRLEDAGYVEAEKRFVGRRPQTLYRMTARGRQAFERYLDELEALLPPRRGPSGG